MANQTMSYDGYVRVDLHGCSARKAATIAETKLRECRAKQIRYLELVYGLNAVALRPVVLDTVINLCGSNLFDVASVVTINRGVLDFTKTVSASTAIVIGVGDLMTRRKLFRMDSELEDEDYAAIDADFEDASHAWDGDEDSEPPSYETLCTVAAYKKAFFLEGFEDGMGGVVAALWDGDPRIVESASLLGAEDVVRALTWPVNRSLGGGATLDGTKLGARFECNYATVEDLQIK